MEIRNFQWDDMPQTVEFMNRHAEARGKSSRVKLEDVERAWRAPYNDPEHNAFIAKNSDGLIVGYTIADLMDEPHFAFGVYQVLPGEVDATRALMKTVTERFRSVALEKSDPDTTIMMDWCLSEDDDDAIAYCKEQGYEQVRQFYTMRIELDQPVPPVTLPEGFTRRPFSADDLEAVFNAKVDIFEDHWGGQYDGLEEWRHRIEQPHFDPDLWWIIYDGEDIAGMVLGQPSSEDSAWIDIVGTRRSSRKRGLAQAMLLQCFAEYQKRGFRAVRLGVDSNSQTKAVEVYQKVGMHIHNTILYYRHILRGA